MTHEPVAEVGFVPIHSGHAIEQVAIAIRFSDEIDDTHLAQVRDALGVLEELPKRSSLRGVTLALTAGMLTPPMAAPEAVIGTVFARPTSDGQIEAALQLERSAITYRTGKYAGWDSLRTFFCDRVLATILSLYVEHVGLASCALAYNDKFICGTGNSMPNVFDIIRTSSPYICPSVYGRRDLWHSHSGSFEKPDDNTRRLVNVNVDYRDEFSDDAPRRALAMLTSLTDHFNQPGYAPLSLAREEYLPFVASRMDDLHSTSKVLLSKILNDAMVQRIALLD